MSDKTRCSEWINENVRYHDSIAEKYKKQHDEIYNDIEQSRLHYELSRCINSIKNNNNNNDIMALDFGAGAGNLTNHLLNLGCDVVAADVSSGCLKKISDNFKQFNEKLNVFKLNGINLDGIEDNTFDMVATYSVLHHIPDYLSIVEELVRVTKPNGLVYIDHESSPLVWTLPQYGIDYLNAYRKKRKLSFRDRWSPNKLLKRVQVKVKKMGNPRYHEEGDIHIWEDDHIEWDKIEQKLKVLKMVDIRRVDYLLCREKDDAPLYEKYKNLYHDMSMLTALKAS